jgi:hypothetical protein
MVLLYLLVCILEISKFRKLIIKYVAYDGGVALKRRKKLYLMTLVTIHNGLHIYWSHSFTYNS